VLGDALSDALGDSLGEGSTATHAAGISAGISQGSFAGSAWGSTTDGSSTDESLGSETTSSSAHAGDSPVTSRPDAAITDTTARAGAMATARSRLVMSSFVSATGRIQGSFHSKPTT